MNHKWHCDNISIAGHLYHDTVDLTHLEWQEKYLFYVKNKFHGDKAAGYAAYLPSNFGSKDKPNYYWPEDLVSLPKQKWMTELEEKENV